MGLLSLLGPQRILAQTPLIRITIQLLRRVAVAHTIVIPIHTILNILWMGILVDNDWWGLVITNHDVTKKKSGNKGGQPKMLYHSNTKTDV